MTTPSLNPSSPSRPRQAARWGVTRGSQYLPHRSAVTQAWLRTTLPAETTSLPTTPIERLLAVTCGAAPEQLEQAVSVARPGTWNTVRVDDAETKGTRINQAFSAAILALITCLGVVLALS